MKPASNIAFKEWASVCEAIAAGTQTIILRKGGIHEGDEGFQPEHAGFWLYPTQFHQTPDDLSIEGAPFLELAQEHIPEDNTIVLRTFVSVSKVDYVIDEARLDDYREQHILSDIVVHRRFHYKQPGLFILHVTASSLETPLVLPFDYSYAGCHTWVELTQAVETP